MEDEPGCKCIRNCWAVVVIILKLVPFRGRINGLFWTLRTLWLCSAVVVRGFLDVFLTFFFPGENNFYVYTNIVCVSPCLAGTHLYIHIHVCAHICKVVCVYTNMRVLPHTRGQRSDWTWDAACTSNPRRCERGPERGRAQQGVPRSRGARVLPRDALSAAAVCSRLCTWNVSCALREVFPLISDVRLESMHYSSVISTVTGRMNNVYSWGKNADWGKNQTDSLAGSYISWSSLRQSGGWNRTRKVSKCCILAKHLMWVLPPVTSGTWTYGVKGALILCGIN